MKASMLAVLTIISVGLISGCGGGSNTPTSISGKVADGYLAGATVFMDKSTPTNPANYQLDPGEPFAISDKDGAYTIMNVDPADVGKYPIVALAIKGVTIDKDTPTEFFKSSYILSMPRESVSGTVNSNFISPMSTQVRELMGTDKYNMQQAMDLLRTQLRLPDGTNMLADYMDPKNPNTTMHTAAQSMAGLMGSQMVQVLGTSGSTVDVNRYRGMMGTIFSSMTSARQPFRNMTGTFGRGMKNIYTNNLMMTAGQPLKNMSTAFRGRMMRK